jgi:hypothetical protein
MRDIYLKMSEPNRARGIENDFLFWFDDEGQEIARLTLNADDNDYFYNRIVLRPENRVEREAKLISHRRLDQAYKTIFKYFIDLKEQSGRGFLDELTLWKKYLLNNSKVLLLKVPDSNLAFVMFETLNDRGVKTSQVDLIKNYLFQEAGRRKDEAQRSWSAMRGIIESVGEEADDVVMEYLRYASYVLYGMVREKEMFDRISEKSHGVSNAIKMTRDLEVMANDYAALFNPEHPKWNNYAPEIRTYLKTLGDLGVKQMRPLLLATAVNFTAAQLPLTFHRLISWAVRLAIAGGSKVGRLDTFYANLANRVHNGEIKNYAQLLASDVASKAIPKDADFESYFETVRVRVSSTARYYLRELEETARGRKDTAWKPNPDTGAVNLEHVMPKEPCSEWSNITEQDVETHSERLGNLALIQASENVLSDRSEFKNKKPILTRSPYLLTAMIGKEFDTWDKPAIEKRQKALAKHASKTWPISAK